VSSFSKAKYASRIDSDVEQILSLDFYQHKAVMQAIQAPFKALESEAGDFNNGLQGVLLSAYMLEKFAWAKNLLKFDSAEYANYMAFLNEERKKNLEEGLESKELIFKARMAYSKIAFILKIIEFGKASKTEYRV